MIAAAGAGPQESRSRCRAGVRADPQGPGHPGAVEARSRDFRLLGSERVHRLINAVVMRRRRGGEVICGDEEAW